MRNELKRVIKNLAEHRDIEWEPTASPERFEARIGDNFVEIVRWEYEPPEDYAYKVYELTVRNARGWAVEEFSSLDEDREWATELAEIFANARRKALDTEDVLRQINRALKDEE